MAFRMTASVKVDGLAGFAPSSIRWNRSIYNFTDVATFKIPARCAIKGKEDEGLFQTSSYFEEGQKVEIKAGYNDDNDLQFMGFVSRINFTVPLEIECEGYSYQLRKKLEFSKSYENTTVLAILRDLVEGTDIKLSEAIPDIPLEKATFKRVTGLQVLEWLKQKCLLTVYFNFDTLYVGLQEVEPKVTKRLRLGWNVIKDSALRFNNEKEFSEVRIAITGRKEDGTKEQAFIGKKDGQVKEFKSILKNKTTLEAIAKQKQKELVNRGYEGGVTCFLKPHIEPGYAIEIEDIKYPERTGKYFVSEVDGRLDTSGGRQSIRISNTL